MKKNIIQYAFSLTLLAAFASCVSDDSTLLTNPIPKIEITQLEEEYSAIAYSQENLIISPEVITGYDDSDMEYSWHVFDDSKKSSYSTTDIVEAEKISDTKELNYKVNLDPGIYTLFFECKANNGYSVRKTTKLNVSTAFSDAFYILKETEDANSELDVLDMNHNTFIQDAISQVSGSPLNGKPYMLSVAFDHGYIDSQNLKKSSNIVSVSTQDGNFQAYGTSNMKPLISKKNLLYSEMDSNEKPYLIVNGYFSIYYLSSNGLRTNYKTSVSSSSSGRYGRVSDDGSSRFANYCTATFGVFYWNEKTHSIMVSDYNGQCFGIEDPKCQTSDLTGYDCLYCGFNNIVGEEIFILQDKADNSRHIYVLGIDERTRAISVNKVVDLVDDMSLSKSKCITFSALTSTYIYSVNNNKIYGYDYESNTETEITANGIPASEQISYISDCYFSNDFDYFIVGTQNGNSYKLYFYEQLGGRPKGAPVFTKEGHGILKSVKYTKKNFETMYSQILYPYND